MAEKKLALDGTDKGWIEMQLIQNPMQFFSFMDGLYEPRFSVGQIGISRQELQYWRKNDLLILVNTSDTRTWTKVSFFDYCWLKLVAEMRKTFIPVEIIKKVKDHLFSMDEEFYENYIKPELLSFRKKAIQDPQILEMLNDFEKDETYLKEILLARANYFLFFVLELIRKNSPASLIIDKDGDCRIVVFNEHFSTEYAKDIFDLFDDSFSAINLNSLLNEFYQNPRIKDNIFQDLFRLTNKEIKVFELLRKENIKEVKVRLGNKGQGIVLVEVTEEKQIDIMKNKIQAILDNEKFQNIRIYVEKGNLQLFEETTKIKL